MLDFEVKKFTRKCAATERELAPGESFYSVLIPDGVQVERQDFSASSWKGPPENSIGWWKSEVPDPKAKKIHWAPNDVMLHFFQQLEDQPQKQDMRYVLTLLMIRRRIFRLEESKKKDNEEILCVFCPKNETEYQVTVHTPTTDRIQEIQQELSELLFAKAT